MDAVGVDQRFTAPRHVKNKSGRDINLHVRNMCLVKLRHDWLHHPVRAFCLSIIQAYRIELVHYYVL